VKKEVKLLRATARLKALKNDCDSNRRTTSLLHLVGKSIGDLLRSATPFRKAVGR
jgi:hypothetical protein